MEEWRNAEGKYYRPNDLPTKITYGYNGDRCVEHWFNKEGKYFRPNDLPNRITYSCDINIHKSEDWLNKDGHYYRLDDLPTRIKYKYNGEKIEMWKCYYGDLDRPNSKPIIMHYNTLGICYKAIHTMEYDDIVIRRIVR